MMTFGVSVLYLRNDSGHGSGTAMLGGHWTNGDVKGIETGNIGDCFII